jgi:hypothetical protein
MPVLWKWLVCLVTFGPVHAGLFRAPVGRIGGMDGFITFLVVIPLSVVLAVLLFVPVLFVIAWPLMKLSEFCTRCPRCNARGLRSVNGLKFRTKLVMCPNAPEFYECGQCRARVKQIGADWFDIVDYENQFYPPPSNT